MKKNDIFLVVTWVFLLGSCHSQNSQEKRKETDTDSIRHVSIKNEKMVPNQEFELVSFDISKIDTIILVTCSEYVYSPFGILRNVDDLKSSLLKDVVIEKKKRNEDIEFEILKKGSDKLVLFFDKDIESAKSSYIVKGEIHSRQISLINNVHVGINVHDFYRTFFDLFPAKYEKQYKVVILESCVVGLRHLYVFNDENKLSLIKFECVDCNFEVDY
jgi:hypothetical protein